MCRKRHRQRSEWGLWVKERRRGLASVRSSRLLWKGKENKPSETGDADDQSVVNKGSAFEGRREGEWAERKWRPGKGGGWDLDLSRKEIMGLSVCLLPWLPRPEFQVPREGANCAKPLGH